MATHHGRPGGRGLELLVILGVLTISVAAYGLVVWVVVLWPSNGVLAMMFGGAVVTGLLAKVWSFVLKYYKYRTDTLEPIVEESPHDRKSD